MLDQAVLLGRKEGHTDRFFTLGRSLCVTGLAVTSPNLMARANADETMPAIFRTGFAFVERGSFVLRECPPHVTNRVHSRLRCSGVISFMFMARSSGASYFVFV